MSSKAAHLAGGPQRMRTLMLIFIAMVVLALWGLGREFIVISNGVNTESEDSDENSAISGGSYVHYPEELFATDWTTQIPLADQLDLGRIQKACTLFKDSVIPWNIGQGRIPQQNMVTNRSDPNLLNRLRQCADFDIYLPRGLRNHGYCEDASAYAKYLGARMLPEWIHNFTIFDPEVGRNVRYHEICPKTPTIFFNHYYDTFLDDAVWPSGKKMILMPNLEMHELQAEQYRRPDIILCKTAVCVRYLNGWFNLHGNPRHTKVFYTRHTSTDVSTIVRAALPSHELSPKDFNDIRFVHTAGTSIQKGSRYVFDCWLKRRDLPMVDVFMDQGLFNHWFKKDYERRINNATNIRLHLGKLNEVDFGHLIVESSFFLCTSLQEGYGHYINQARASGGLILTPDVPPMNELVTPSSGVLVRAEGVGNEYQFLGGNGKHPLALRNVTGFVARFGGKEVCEAVDYVIKRLDVDERKRKAERAKQQYFFDTAFFARAMAKVRKELRMPPLGTSNQKLRSP